MATSIAHHSSHLVELDRDNGSIDKEEDPFSLHTPEPEQRRPHRYSSFDTQLFAMNNASSPSQAKRALEAHLSETDRRLQEASRLGTALVQQRKELSARLVEVEQQQGEREIGPELRQKLIEIEKEYSEIGRESARAFLAPKPRVQSSDESSNGHAVMDARVPDILPGACITLTNYIETRKPVKVHEPGFGFSIEAQCAIEKAAQPTVESSA
jgi:hypothetical protein